MSWSRRHCRACDCVVDWTVILWWCDDVINIVCSAYALKICLWDELRAPVRVNLLDSSEDLPSSGEPMCLWETQSCCSYYNHMTKPMTPPCAVNMAKYEEQMTDSTVLCNVQRDRNISPSQFNVNLNLSMNIPFILTNFVSVYFSFLVLLPYIL